jgi:hypothetical protein
MREHMVDRLGVRTHRTYDGSIDTKDAIHTAREFLTLIRPCVHPLILAAPVSGSERPDRSSVRAEALASASRRASESANPRTELPLGAIWSVASGSA